MQCHLSNAEQLTVGKIFQLNCVAEVSEVADLKPESLELRLEKKDEYALKILSFEKLSEKDIQFNLTSYKTGQHQLKALQVVSGDKSFVLGDLQFSVQSVIKQEEPVTEPYGSIGPLGVHIPLWYWLVAVLVILTVVFQITWNIRKRSRKMKLLNAMNIDSIAQDPTGQFFQTARKLQRQYSFFSGAQAQEQDIAGFIEELARAYKIYLARVFRVPTLDWSERQILGDIKRNHRLIYSEIRDSLKKTLTEVSRAQKATKGVTDADCTRLLELVRQQIEQTENIRRQQSQGKQI